MTDEVWKRMPRLQKEQLRDYSNLSPQLIGKENVMVEVIDNDGSEPRRFFVGRSGGPAPVHVELPSRDAKVGEQAKKRYKSVRRIAKGLPPTPKKIQVTFYRPDVVAYQGKTGRRTLTPGELG